MQRKRSGYSLYELLVTLAIASLLIVVGIPMLEGSVSRSRQSVEINALFHAIHLARKESIVRRRPVSICPSLDGDRCEPGRDWS
ncbi:MAG: GspH/FimT family pseudopilin, partial [Woeseiaceae bacterium]|nr:GspH/FimT family pseudopilin [Woeseiaceae bacterium]